MVGRMKALATIIPVLCTPGLPGCGDDLPVVEPVATTVEVVPGEAELTASGERTGFNAVVRDQNGSVMLDAEVMWYTSDPAVFTVEGEGRVANITAVSSGEAVRMAQSGEADGMAYITVVLTPGRIEIVSGNDQVGVRERTLAERVVVRVAEETGSVVPGVMVSFMPGDEYSGSVDPPEVITGLGGTASAIWTLGSVRRQTLVATALDGELKVGFRARATADPPIPDYKIIGEIRPSRTDPLDTETVELTAHVINEGDAASEGPITVAFYAGDMELGTVKADPVELNEIGEATF